MSDEAVIAYLPCTMADWGAKIHAVSREKGFYEGEPIMPTCGEVCDGDQCGGCADMGVFEEQTFFFATTKLALAMGEISEAIEDLRKDNREHEAEEIADAIIRLLDYAAWRGFDMDVEVAKKTAFNTTRPYKHGKTHG